MTASKERRTTKYTPKEGRVAWIARLKHERELWIARHPKIGKWRLRKIADDQRGVNCECACGRTQVVRLSDLKAGTSKACRSCAGRVKMKRLLKENPAKWRRHLKKAAAIRATTNSSKYNAAEQTIQSVMVGAKQRCNNKLNLSYPNYGGRGIRFVFDSVEVATRWVYKNLGPKPKGRYGIDRIDNNRHYEPGNLRWATDEEQARNKRKYRRSAEGERLRRLASIRTDYTAKGLWRYIKAGFSDEQIINMPKPKGGRKRRA